MSPANAPQPQYLRLVQEPIPIRDKAHLGWDNRFYLAVLEEALQNWHRYKINLVLEDAYGEKSSRVLHTVARFLRYGTGLVSDGEGPVQWVPMHISMLADEINLSLRTTKRAIVTLKEARLLSHVVTKLPPKNVRISLWTVDLFHFASFILDHYDFAGPVKLCQ